MKKLTEINKEDAVSILSKIYPLLFVNKFNENNEKDWKLINCDDIEPGCKKLFNENKIYVKSDNLIGKLITTFIGYANR